MAWCCPLQPECLRISAIIFWVPGAPDHASRWARALGSELRQTLQGFVHVKPGCLSAPADLRRISGIIFWVPEAPNHASRWARALGWELRQTLQGFVHVKPGCLSAPADLRRISAIIFWVPGAPDHASRWARALGSELRRTLQGFVHFNPDTRPQRRIFDASRLLILHHAHRKASGSATQAEVRQTWHGVARFNPDARASRLLSFGCLGHPIMLAVGREPSGENCGKHCKVSSTSTRLLVRNAGSSTHLGYYLLGA